MGLILIAFLEEKEFVEKIERMKDGLVSAFLFSPCILKRKSPITTKAS